MATPRFSVLIPTRDRPATFRHTLATVASQSGDDYEIVVADNCSGPEVSAIVKQLAFPRLHYTRSDQILPMADNWERGMNLCSGEFVTVLGDDDGFLPSTLQMARTLIAATEAEIISWSPHTYWWPDTIVTWCRNILIVELGNSAMIVKSRNVLERFYQDNTRSFGSIPMIYSGFFHRGVIEEARRRYDGFFVPTDISPDIGSGILGLYLTENYAYSQRPLSVRGNSGKSNGTAHWVRSLGAEHREAFYREERIGLRGIVHKSLIPSPNLGIMIASAKLKCRETYFPSDEALAVDLHEVLKDMIVSLNFEPEAYEENLEDAGALAAKLGVKLDSFAIPPKQPKERKRYWGPAVNADKSVPSLIVNCDLAGVYHVADAARLIESLLPPADRYLET